MDYLINSFYLSVLFMTIVLFVILSGILIVRYKTYKKRRADILKFLIFILGMAIIILLVSLIAFGLTELEIFHRIGIVIVSLYFSIFILPLWRRLDRRLLFTLISIGSISVGLLVLKMFVPDLFIELVYILVLFILVLSLFLLVLRFVISISK